MSSKEQRGEEGGEIPAFYIFKMLFHNLSGLGTRHFFLVMKTSLARIKGRGGGACHSGCS